MSFLLLHFGYINNVYRFLAFFVLCLLNFGINKCLPQIEILDSLMFTAYTRIYFCLLLAFVFTSVFNLYSINFFFSYITIVVYLYGTAHGKHNQLYNYFGFWFLCLQHIPVFIYLFFAFGFCVYWLVFLICTVQVIYFFLYNHCC